MEDGMSTHVTSTTLQGPKTGATAQGKRGPLRRKFTIEEEKAGDYFVQEQRFGF